MAAHSPEPEFALSIIVPVLNEAQRIGACLSRLHPARDIEVIIADGGSTDGTLEKLPQWVTRVLHCPRGRARQMNAAAAVARGRLLVFLHADSLLEAAAWRRLRSLAAASDPGWGRFDVSLSGPGLIYRIIGACMNLRSRLTGICTGDQVLFVPALLYRRIGGFPDIPLMEDIAVSSTLLARQRPCCCRERVTVSSRRWRRYGVLRTIVLMWRLRLAFYLGADPARLAGIYYQESHP